MSHTPGPWYVYRSNNYSISVKSQDKRIRGAIAKCNYGAEDAQLISCAPELLSILEALLHATNKDKEGNYVISKEDTNILKEAFSLTCKAQGVPL